MSKFNLPKRYASSSKESVWEEYTKLQLKYNVVNLGQGFPNYLPAKYITDTLAGVANSENALVHQYTLSSGHPRLVNAISNLYSDEVGRKMKPDEILITDGGMDGLFCSIAGHVDAGDEVILIEPFFDSYAPMVQSAGGVPVYIPLRQKVSDSDTSLDATQTSADWYLDESELASLFNIKTKAIILNTPHNPTGKIFSLSELNAIADLCKKWDVLCISDEVYEWVVFDTHKHIRIASLPNMWDRTITICSAGKTFGITGWRIGWAYGDSELIANLKVVNENSRPTPLQEALAIIIEKQLEDFESSYLNTISQKLQYKRDAMVQMLTSVGLKPIIPQAGIFMLVDWTPFADKIDLFTEIDEFKDYRFTKWLIKNAGVLTIPPSAFCSHSSKPLFENFARFCFMKNKQTLNDLKKALKKLL